MSNTSENKNNNHDESNRCQSVITKNGLKISLANDGKDCNDKIEDFKRSRIKDQQNGNYNQSIVSESMKHKERVKKEEKRRFEDEYINNINRNMNCYSDSQGLEQRVDAFNKFYNKTKLNYQNQNQNQTNFYTNSSQLHYQVEQSPEDYEEVLNKIQRGTKNQYQYSERLQNGSNFPNAVFSFNEQDAEGNYTENIIKRSRIIENYKDEEPMDFSTSKLQVRQGYFDKTIQIVV